MKPYLELDSVLLMYYLIDFIIAIGLLAGVRKLAGIVSNVSSSEEIAKRDNPAFGLAIGGVIIALAIMLMGVLSGDIGLNPASELYLMLGYGVLGILLMWLTRIVFDRLSMPAISIQRLIMDGNIAAGLVDAGNLIATAIIIRSLMSWVDSTSVLGVAMILGGYIFSQVILLMATLYRSKVFAKRHPGESIQDRIAAGNTALAARFAGYRIGIALAVAAASGVVSYIPGLEWKQLFAWLVVAVILFTLLTLIAVLMRKVVLHGIDVAEEVDQQSNIAVGVIEASIYLAVGLILAGLFA